ncbi:DJ-1/PfpI family protein [Aliiroseovarius crassostreae]|uniref:DJ-1/PfpI family protein n=1 Tax=Aliiroseovarius crassostreae TaxID=154981 RepID=UPI003C7A7E34
MNEITLLLADAFADWEYAFIAGTGGAYFDFNIGFITPDPGMVRSQGGLMVHVADGIDRFTPDASTTLVVIGSAIWAGDTAPDTRAGLPELLQAHHDAGGVVAGICGGTLPLARAGLLDHCAHSSNSLAFLTDAVAPYKGQGHYVAGPKAVSDNRIVTAPGTAPVSFTAEVFAQSGLDPEACGQFRTMLAAEHA